MGNENPDQIAVPPTYAAHHVASAGVRLSQTASERGASRRYRGVSHTHLPRKFSHTTRIVAVAV